MINPFRNLSSGALSAVNLHAAGTASKTRSRSKPAKGFNQGSKQGSKQGSRPSGFFPGLTSIGNIFRQPDPTQPDPTKPEEQDHADQSLVDHSLDNDQNQITVASDIDLPLDAPACLEKGRHLAQAGQMAAAIRHYRQAIKLDANFGEAYQHLAEALTEQGQLEAAASYYRQAIALADQNADQNLEVPTPIEPEPPKIISTHIRVSRKPRSAPLTASSTTALTTSPIAAQKQATTPIIHPSTHPPIPWFEQAMFHLQQGIVNCNSGRWQEAVTACEAALNQLEPEAFTVYAVLGHSLQQQQQFDQAEQAYRKALTLQPTSADTYARLASLYVDQQRLTEAAQLYQKATQHQPKFAKAYAQLAAVWQQLGETERAVACRHQAYELQPDLGDAVDYSQLATQLLQLGQAELAQRYYQQALQQQPDLIEAYLGLGRALNQQNQPEAAILAYRNVVKQNPANPQIYIELSTAFEQLAQWSDALVCYQRLAQLAPNSDQIVSSLRQCYLHLEQWSEALIYCQKQVELAPNSAQDWHQLAEVHSRLEQWSEAVSAYQTALALDASFSWSHNNLGDALLKLEDWPQAVSAFRAAIALNPNFAWSHYNLGVALTELQDWNNAINAYQTALQLQPDLPHLSGQLAYALQQRAQADRSSAIAFYQRAIQQNPQDPDHYHKALELSPEDISLYFGLVDALLGQERFDEALVCCQIVRQLHPDHADVLPKLQEVLQKRELNRKPLSSTEADYQLWIAQQTPSPEQLLQMADAVSKFAYQPLISILMPVHNPPIAFLGAAIQSVLDQVYPHWQLCIADDASTDPQVQQLLQQYQSLDGRIQVIYRSENGHISAASNSALAQASGDYVALLDHDDLLAPEALYEIVNLLNQHPEADMVYSDEDKLNQQGQRVEPFFKPDWCPDSFLSRMYTCHLGVYRRSLVEAIGGFRLGFEGSQDYDLVLRLTEQTDQVWHLPKVLYHWRNHAASASSSHDAKPYAEAAAKRALAEACQRRGEAIQTIVTDAQYPGVYTIRYEITAHKRVSIIIPTRNLGQVLDRCLQSIFAKTTYPNYEVILVDNGSDEPETLEVIAKWQQESRFKSYPLDIPFNYSTLNNYAVSQAQGDYLLFLNNDTEVISEDWIEALVEQVQRPTVGAVGGLLLYPDQTIQHAGVILGLGGVAGHSHKHFPDHHPGYCRQIVSINNYSAITAACLICRRDVFEQVNGFDESLAVAFNDVDFCLKIKQLGYHNVYLPHVKLYHHESKSRGLENTPQKRRRFEQEQETVQRKWHILTQSDSCYSPHLTIDREDYSLKI